MIKNLNTQTASSTTRSVVLHVTSTNNLVTSLASTLLGLNNSSAFTSGNSTSSQALSKANIQVSSIISSTNWVSVLSAFAFSEKIGIVNLVGSADTVVLLSNLGTSHKTLISVGLIINTTDRYIPLMAFTVLL
jgi:hypothetical protein